eukprot:CAMPEP_0168222608 /NCGR_PEP_ID=MMETSP0140_2-20121125/10762_1 /TAXON_ID=44445 /ORGANISM="Pseudo-nitzschia australis, Strain 10249 10 AB" /LENGTH=776 /DNA_ID=CAMNT_0008152223 /DNA_START=55 /DNA_END=2387 /DNA_ORIENTATION=-
MAAAPPSKQSPSNQEMRQSEDSRTNDTKHQQEKRPPATTTTMATATTTTTMLKDPPASVSTAGAATASGDGVANVDATADATADAVPTYHSSETSANYILAKQLLNAGSFEDALSAIEQQLVETEKAVRRSTNASSSAGTASSTDNEQIVDVELHESLAPLHYLYGTTLLYSLEEAKDDGNDNAGGMAMMTEAAAKATSTTNTTAGAGVDTDTNTDTNTNTTAGTGTNTTAGTNNSETAVSQEGTPAAASADPTNPWAHLASSSPEPAPQTDNGNGNEMAEDIQYAWENLEAARTIVLRMLTNTAPEVSNTTTSQSSVDLKSPEVAKLQLKCCVVPCIAPYTNVNSREYAHFAPPFFGAELFLCFCYVIPFIDDAIPFVFLLLLFVRSFVPFLSIIDSISFRFRCHKQNKTKHSDLAQIHLREGDLQRINGNYTSAVGDYSSCLELLLQHNNTPDPNNNGEPRNLDRKIADTQFNLGLTYLTSSSDLQKELASASNDDDNNNDNDNTAEDKRQKAAALAKDHREKGVRQQVDCAKTFCGILAKLCNVEPETIWSESDSVGDPNNEATAKATATAKQPAAGFKTTGLDDDDDDAKTIASSAAAAAASQTVTAWRKAVATLVASNSALTPSNTPGDDDSTARVLDIRDLLDEIQETIDEAERSQEGVLQAARIRVRAQNAVAALGDASGAAGVTNRDGSTTTIGFGAAAAVVSSSVGAAAGTESVASEAAVATAKPMMVVKRKKKRKDAGGDGQGGDMSNKPAVAGGDDDSNKRAKTE